jgi:hypothetical protein
MEPIGQLQFSPELAAGSDWKPRQTSSHKSKVNHIDLNLY